MSDEDDAFAPGDTFASTKVAQTLTEKRPTRFKEAQSVSRAMQFLVDSSSYISSLVDGVRLQAQDCKRQSHYLRIHSGVLLTYKLFGRVNVHSLLHLASASRYASVQQRVANLLALAEREDEELSVRERIAKRLLKSEIGLEMSFYPDTTWVYKLHYRVDPFMISSETRLGVVRGESCTMSDVLLSLHASRANVEYFRSLSQDVSGIKGLFRAWKSSTTTVDIGVSLYYV